MHLVTKILIVFAALFAVLLAALAMAFSYNAQSLRESITAERADRDAATTALRDAQTSAQTQIANAKTSAEQATGALNAMRTDLANALNERAKLMADFKTAQIERDRFMNESQSNVTRLQTATELSKSLQDENAKLRSDFIRQSKELTDLMVRISDLDSQNQVMTQNVRALQEQLADATAAANKKATATTDARTGSEITTGPVITARVSKTAKAPSGNDLAYITAGSGAGIKAGQRLNIVRGGKYIGALVILTADVNEAVGRIDTLGTGNTVMADDTVLSRVN